jgi:hypothetical protein
VAPACSINFQGQFAKSMFNTIQINNSNLPVWGDTGGWTRPEGGNVEFEFELVFEAGGAASELVTATKGGIGDRFGARRRASSLRRFDP